MMDELARSPAAGLGAYHALVALAEAVSGPPVRIMVATFGAEEVLDEPVHQPAAALTIGPVLTLPIEVPNLEMRSINFGPLHETGSFAFVAKALVLEAASTDLENVIAWRGGRRWMRRLERISASGAADNGLPLKRGGVYLITGGLGGIWPDDRTPICCVHVGPHRANGTDSAAAARRVGRLARGTFAGRSNCNDHPEYQTDRTDGQRGADHRRRCR